MSPELPAGRELDGLIAERVLGLVRCRSAFAHGGERGWPNDTCYALPESPEDGGELRGYSTEISEAWGVIEKLRQQFTVTLMLPPGEALWSCEFKEPHPTRKHYRYHYAVAPTAPHAICLAALKAVGAVSPEAMPEEPDHFGGREL